MTFVAFATYTGFALRDCGNNIKVFTALTR
jgi:hypothetical protein